MASLRTRNRKDGTIYFAVLYRLAGKQTSTSFHDLVSATKFQKLVEQVGPAKALEMMDIAPVSDMTVGQWLEHYIDHLTGLEKLTISSTAPTPAMTSRRCSAPSRWPRCPRTRSRAGCR